jgi:hypothetical protein
MIGPSTWVYSATVGVSTAGASMFPRRRGRARRGALRREFRGEHLNLGGTRGGTKLVPKFRGYPVRCTGVEWLTSPVLGCHNTTPFA